MAGSSAALETANGDDSYSYNSYPTAHFPEPLGIKSQVDFWIDIYSKYGENHAIVHDAKNLDVKYEVVDFDKVFKSSYSRKKKNRYMEKRKKRYKRILRKLAKQNGACRTSDECRVASLFGNQRGKSIYRKAARAIRVQYGLANRFQKGLTESGLYMEEMRRIFSSYGLPLELLALPHVESSFNVKAYSKYGAAGVWQFTRSTGRRYLRINYSVDERRDPIISTDAAARLLKRNYMELKSWPLAITAYNHGRRGMERAKKKHGDDIVKIIGKYKSRSFGFASRNFYAEFLAAKKVMEDPGRYFGYVRFKESLKYDSVKLPHYMSAKLLTGHFGYSKNRMVSLNPALRQSIWLGTRRIPKGYRLKIPEMTKSTFKVRYEEIPKNKLFAKQIQPNWYYVKRGDALSTIARRFRTSIRSLQTYNGIDNRHRIYVGQKLRIPGRGKKPRKRILVASNKPLEEKKIKPVKVEKKRVVLNKKVSASKKIIAPPVIAALPKNRPKPTPVAFAVGSIETPPIEGFRFHKVGESYGFIRVQPEETVGHYSYWSGVSVSRILRLNGWSRRKHIRLGQKVKIPLKRVSSDKFEARRYEYHLSVFEDFFSAYRVERVDTLTVERGQSLWVLCHVDYSVPLWLVRLYNDGEALVDLQPGQKIRMPIVGKKES